MGLALDARDLFLAYRQAGRSPVEALAIPRFTCAGGDATGVTGPSGSGKTSLLAVLTGIERTTTGRVTWGTVDVTALSEAARDRWRRRTVGFVFQELNLFPGLSALGNVVLPATFGAIRTPRSVRERARALLERVGLGDGARPAALLSRGEQQRVALARALFFAPPILVADEPTASLDAASGARVTELLIGLAREAGSTLLVASHDPALLARLDRVVTLVNGRVGVSPPDSPVPVSAALDFRPEFEPGGARR